MSTATGEIAVQSPALWEALGGTVGRVDAKLAGFSHPALDREHEWDVRHSYAVWRDESALSLLDNRQRRGSGPSVNSRPHGVRSTPQKSESASRCVFANHCARCWLPRQ